MSFTYRSRLAPFVPERMRSLPIFARSHTYTPLATFNDQVQAGMSSQAFDIEANIRDGDARAGLDEVGTREVMEIMRGFIKEYVAIMEEGKGKRPSE